MSHSESIVSWPWSAKIAVLANIVAWAGLWMNQVLTQGMISLVHVTLALFLLVLLTARVRMAWVACLAYNILLAGSKGHGILIDGPLELHTDIVLDGFVVFTTIAAIILLMWPQVVRFFLTRQDSLNSSQKNLTGQS